MLKLLSNYRGKVESNLFFYAAMCFPHRHINVLIFTQGMHKPKERSFMRKNVFKLHFERV